MIDYYFYLYLHDYERSPAEVVADGICGFLDELDQLYGEQVL